MLALLLALVAGCTTSGGPGTPSPGTGSPTTAPTTAPSTPTPTPTAEPTPSPTRIPDALLGTDVERLPDAGQVVALTFDGGSSDTAVGPILATLEAEGVLATFFLTGDFARRYPQSVALIRAGGHRLGNHSDTHAHYPQLLDTEIAADLERAESAIVAAGGAPAKPLFRFPFGDRTGADVRAVNSAGYLPVRWTVDTLGWRGTSGGITARTVLDRVLGSATPGQIVLMHLGAHPQDGSTLDADALPAMIAALRDRGYGFVTLDVLLEE